MAITKEFKAACGKAGIALIIIFALRVLTDITVFALSALLGDADPTLRYYVLSITQIIILYGGSIICTAAALGIKPSDIFHLLGKTQRLGKAVSWIVPTYGAGQLINFTVLFISYILLKNTSAVQQTYNPMTSGDGALNLPTAVFLVLQLSVFAPIFEEIWFRGVIQTALKDYGNGFAIMVSALCFGMAHGNLHQFCYTFVIGIMLGYVRYATDSIKPTMIIHCILNSIAAVIFLLVSSEPVISAINKASNGIEPDSFENTMLTVLGVYMLIIVIFMVIGIVSAIGKLKNNRLYRPINNYTIAAKGEKLAALCKNPLFILGFLLCAGYIAAIILI